MVTTTFTAPAACDEVVAVIELLLFSVTLVAAAPPKDTLAPVRKPVPVTVTVVPPAVEPDEGDTALTVGAGFGYVNPPASIPL